MDRLLPPPPIHTCDQTSHTQEGSTEEQSKDTRDRQTERRQMEERREGHAGTRILGTTDEGFGERGAERDAGNQSSKRGGKTRQSTSG